MFRIMTLTAAVLALLGATLSTAQAGPFDPPVRFHYGPPVAPAYGPPTYAVPSYSTSHYNPPAPIVRRRHHDHVHVQYRLPYWREQVFGNPFVARNFEQERISKGFEVSTMCVGGEHIVRYRMIGWNTYQTADCFDEARDMERYLESRGYQVRLIPH